MKIIKVYETIINLSAVELFSNIDEVVKNKLEKRYENKCEKNSLIIRILDIVKRSECKMAKNRLDGAGDVDVQFRAEAIVYNDDDILTGCEVQRIERGNKIICKHERAVINIKGNKNLQSLKPGQKITIKISSVSYLKSRDKITIHGVPYSYSYKFIIYSTTLSNITMENMEILKKKLQEIDDEYKLYEQSDKKLVKFFNDMFYQYKKKFDDTKNDFESSKIHLLDVYELTTKIIQDKNPDKYLETKPNDELYLFRHPIIDKSTPLICRLNESDFKKGISGNFFDTEVYNIEVVKENIVFVLLNFLNDYLCYIRIIKEMTAIYPTEKELENHNNIWSIYNRLKR